MGFFGRDDKQQEQLVATYSERSDGELLQMYEGRDGLTDAAQQALATVLRQRKLDVVDAAVASEDEPEPAAVNPDELVYMFDDAFDAREAMRHLTEAGVEHRIVDWHTVDTELRKVRPTLQLGLLVPENEQKRAIAILREKLDLFSDAVEGATPLKPIDELALLDFFDVPSALKAAQALGEAGISYFWRDSRDETNILSYEETVAIEVRSSQADRAAKVVEQRFESSQE